MKPKKEEFELKKVKLLKDGGIEIIYFETKVDDTGTHLIKKSIESPQTPHEDLSNKIKALSKYMTKCYGIDSVLALKSASTLSAKQKDAVKTLEKQISGIIGGVQSDIEVTTINISGSDAKRAVVISGKKLQANRSYVAMNSPRIAFSLDQFKFEAELEDEVNKIKDEVYDYIYKSKKAAPALLDEAA